MMRYASVLLIPALFLMVAADDAAKTEPIFNGKDLTGWKAPKDNIWWSVSDGVLVCQSGPKRKGSTLWTEQSYRDFVVECEFRFEGSVDSGVFMRTEKAQVQIGDSGSLKRDMTGSMYIPGKGYPKDAQGEKVLKPAGEWNHLRATARGNDYRVWLNGTHVLDYTGEDAPETGPIGLQLHGNKDMRIEFRNIRAAELK